MATRPRTTTARADATSSRGLGFSNEEVEIMLDLVEQRLPQGNDHWENLTALFNVKINNPNRVRDVDAIRGKFNRLIRHKKPTGDPECPPDVVRAKRAQRLIEQHAEVAGVSEDDEDEENNGGGGAQCQAGGAGVGGGYGGYPGIARGGGASGSLPAGRGGAAGGRGGAAGAAGGRGGAAGAAGGRGGAIGDGGDQGAAGAVGVNSEDGDGGGDNNGDVEADIGFNNDDTGDTFALSPHAANNTHEMEGEEQQIDNDQLGGADEDDDIDPDSIERDEPVGRKRTRMEGMAVRNEPATKTMAPPKTKKRKGSGKAPLKGTSRLGSALYDLPTRRTSVGSVDSVASSVSASSFQSSASTNPPLMEMQRKEERLEREAREREERQREREERDRKDQIEREIRREEREERERIRKEEREESLKREKEERAENERIRREEREEAERIRRAELEESERRFMMMKGMMMGNAVPNPGKKLF
ncbi:hypothetical protein HDU76_006989 [Blyttiomyces sp. JEL0837]|nr:hypothetical protein HDU76_006989 [Blyttiomyces sp. JEL0837]